MYVVLPRQLVATTALLASPANGWQEHLDDHELAGFGAEDFVKVRVAISAYGIHLVGKVRIPAMPDSGPAYIHFRVFVAGGDEPAKLHCIHTEEKDEAGGGKTYRAIFTKEDPLEWFDT